LETSSRNFNRAAVVESPVTHGVRTDWVPIAQGQLRLVDFHGYHSEDLKIALSEHRGEEYRIVVRNEDSPPLSITGVKARGNEYRAVFLAAADEPYRLGYGSDRVEEPKYDAAAVLFALGRGRNAVVAALGPQVANPASAAAADGALSARRLLNNPLLLGGLGLGLAALLGWAIFQATRRISQLPQDPGN
jgi:hypothetical protein